MHVHDKTRLKTNPNYHVKDKQTANMEAETHKHKTRQGRGI